MGNANKSCLTYYVMKNMRGGLNMMSDLFILETLMLNNEYPGIPEMTNSQTDSSSLFEKALSGMHTEQVSNQFNGFVLNPLLDEDSNILLEEN